MSGIVFTALIHQMLFPSICARTNVQVTQWATIRTAKRFGWQTLFFLSVGLVYLLMDCLFTTWASFIVFTVLTLACHMRCKKTDFDSLFAFETDGEDWTWMEKVHINVILLYEFRVKFVTVLTVFDILLGLIVFSYIDELIFILNLVFILRLCFILSSFRFDRLIFVIPVIPFSSFHLFLNCLDDLWSDIFKERLKRAIPHLRWNGNNGVDRCSSDIVIFVIDVLDYVDDGILIVFAQLILADDFPDHFQSSCQYFWWLLSFVCHCQTPVTHIFTRQLIHRKIAVNCLWNLDDLLVCMTQIIANLLHYVFCVFEVVWVSTGLHFSHEAVEQLQYSD